MPILPAVLSLLLLIASCGGAEAEGEPIRIDESAEEITGGPTKGVVAVTAGDVAADAGFIGDGDSIGVPTGFTAEQCVFTAALASVSGESIATRVTVNPKDGRVTCKVTELSGSQSRPAQKGCTASYTVICAK